MRLFHIEAGGFHRAERCLYLPSKPVHLAGKGGFSRCRQDNQGIIVRCLTSECVDAYAYIPADDVGVGQYHTLSAAERGQYGLHFAALPCGCITDVTVLPDSEAEMAHISARISASRHFLWESCIPLIQTEVKIVLKISMWHFGFKDSCFFTFNKPRCHFSFSTSYQGLIESHNLTIAYSIKTVMPN